MCANLHQLRVASAAGSAQANASANVGHAQEQQARGARARVNRLLRATSTMQLLR